MIFGIVLGIVLFVSISITLIGLYVVFKRFCSDTKDYGMINANSTIKHGRLYPVLNYKDCDDDGAGGSGSDDPVPGHAGPGILPGKSRYPGEVHHGDGSCSPLGIEKEPDYASPASLTKPYGKDRDVPEPSPPSTSTPWKPTDEPHASSSAVADHPSSHVNEAFHNGLESTSGYSAHVSPSRNDGDDDGE
uniref:Uncharacterized protein n=1 Tax=Ixodes ricinus TaxID=34613 RepID=V5IG86_IXORI